MKLLISRHLSVIFLFVATFGVRADEARAINDRVTITPDFIARLLAEAVDHNPSLAAASARQDAAHAAVGAVRTWEDPTFTVGFSSPTARGFKASEEGNILYGVEQKLPVFDRPKLAQAAAEAGDAKEKLIVSFATEKLRRDLTLALADLALEDATVDLAQQDLGWLEVTSTAVDYRYRVGKGSQVDWLKLQIEKAKIVDRLKTLKLEREHQQVQLNRLLNRELHAAWPAANLPALSPALNESDELVNAATLAEPRLKILRQETVEAEANASITRQTRKPEFGVGLEGRSYSGDAGFREGTLSVNFTLPWLNRRRYASDLERDRAKVRATESDTADYILTVREEIHHLIVDLDAARRQVLLYRDELIPLTEQTLSSANQAWANSLGLFQDVLEVRRMLVDQQLTLAQSLADQTRTLAELNFITGQSDLSGFVHSSTPPPHSEAVPGISP